MHTSIDIQNTMMTTLILAYIYTVKAFKYIIEAFIYKQTIFQLCFFINCRHFKFRYEFQWRSSGVLTITRRQF